MQNSNAKKAVPKNKFVWDKDDVVITMPKKKVEVKKTVK
jgi:hypothetical protein